MRVGLNVRRWTCRLLAMAMLLGGLTALAEPEEMIEDGGFDGPLRFQLYTESGGGAALSAADGALRVDVSSVGRVAHAIQPYYDGFGLKQGATYRLSWDARSTAPRRMFVRVQLNGGDYHAYYEELINVDEQTRHFSSEFTMNEPSDPAPRLCVNMGQVEDDADPGAHQVFFDNFSLTMTDPGDAVPDAPAASAGSIRLNQAGYAPDAVKTAVFADVAGKTFAVVNAESGEAVYEGRLDEAVDNPWAGERDALADFSALAAPGVYRLKAEDGTLSPAFRVAEDAHRELLRAAVYMLYLQRCGVQVSAEQATDYAHPACHTGLALIYGTDERIDVSGGWHDAGDYGRYVVSGAKTVADLLLAYERYDGVIDDIAIPESGDGVDDLLQEAKFELDWMLKMQAASGGVYHKVTCRSFPGFVMPEAETDELVVSPISNAATGDFAAVMAMASRVFAESGSPALAASAGAYLDAAKRAWAWLEAHEGEPGFVNPPEIVTGEYGDDSDLDEYLWAAAELARTTREPACWEAAARYADSARLGLGWQEVGTYGLYTLATDDQCPQALRERARARLTEAAREAIMAIRSNPYGITRTDSFEWGSNMGVANDGLLLLMADELAPGEGMREAARRQLDYLLGENATGYCFVTGFGEQSPLHPHHRPSVAVGQPMPGMLVGGPDSGLHDPCAANVLKDAAPAKCYVDNDQSYSTNEICVYWNSPLITLLIWLGVR